MRSGIFGWTMAAAVWAGALQAGGVMELVNWSATTGGNNITPAEVSVIDTPKGPAIQAKVVQEGRYQGLDLILPEPIDLAKVEKITFKIHQTAYNRYPCHGCLHLNYDQNNGVMTAFVMEKPVDGWSEVTVVPDLSKCQSLRRSVPVSSGTVISAQFTIYAALSKPGQVMEIADLQFHLKAE